MTTPEYCLDCRAVDPEMTAGGLSSKQMQEIAKQAGERAPPGSQ
jgi:hypothetical protein